MAHLGTGSAWAGAGGNTCSFSHQCPDMPIHANADDPWAWLWVTNYQSGKPHGFGVVCSVCFSDSNSLGYSYPKAYSLGLPSQVEGESCVTLGSESDCSAHRYGKSALLPFILNNEWGGEISGPSLLHPFILPWKILQESVLPQSQFSFGIKSQWTQSCAT